MKYWHNKYHWFRNNDGTVSVYNMRNNYALTFPNMGHALNAAKAAKTGKNIRFIATR